MGARLSAGAAHAARWITASTPRLAIALGLSVLVGLVMGTAIGLATSGLEWDTIGQWVAAGLTLFAVIVALWGPLARERKTRPSLALGDLLCLLDHDGSMYWRLEVRNGSQYRSAEDTELVLSLASRGTGSHGLAFVPDMALADRRFQWSLTDPPAWTISIPPGGSRMAYLARIGSDRSSVDREPRFTIEDKPGGAVIGLDGPGHSNRRFEVVAVAHHAVSSPAEEFELLWTGYWPGERSEHCLTVRRRT